MPQITKPVPTKQKPTEDNQREPMTQLAGRDAVTSRLRSKRAELTEEIDDLLDEIDAVLEENAEEFVSSYVQKGGQ